MCRFSAVQLKFPAAHTTMNDTRYLRSLCIICGGVGGSGRKHDEDPSCKTPNLKATEELDWQHPTDAGAFQRFSFNELIWLPEGDRAKATFERLNEESRGPEYGLHRSDVATMCVLMDGPLAKIPRLFSRGPQGPRLTWQQLPRPAYAICSDWLSVLIRESFKC